MNSSSHVISNGKNQNKLGKPSEGLKKICFFLQSIISIIGWVNSQDPLLYYQLSVLKFDKKEKRNMLTDAK